jgi:hypothetical protein
LALQRRHVSLLHSSIEDEQAWVVPMGAKPIIGPPKSEAGVRTLVGPPNVLAVLEDHLERFVGPGADSSLFGTSNGTELSSRNFNRIWTNAGKQSVGRTSTFTTFGNRDSPGPRSAVPASPS